MKKVDAGELVRPLPWSELARHAGALERDDPEALLHPKIRGAIHVGLEVDGFSAADLVLLVEPLLGHEARFDAYVRQAVRGPLGARLRLAALCRAVAAAADSAGSLSKLLPPEREGEFVAVLERLLSDRDSGVGRRAAWALGTLINNVPAALAVVERADAPDADPIRRRRVLVARASAWLQGDLPDEAFLYELREGLGHSDVNARASVVAALELGLSLAPETVYDLVESLLDEKTAVEVLLAAARLARAPGVALRQASLLERVQRLARRKKNAPPALRLWLDEGRSPERKVRDELVALRAAASLSLAHAAEPARLLAADLHQLALKASARSSGEKLALLEAALYDSPLVRDVAFTCARGRKELGERQKQWNDARRALLTLSADSAVSEREERLARRDAVRRLGRAIDSQPREEAAEAQGALQSLVHTATKSNDKAFDLAHAVALSAWLDRLLWTESLGPADAAALLVAIASQKLLQNLSSMLPPGDVAHLARTLSQLRRDLEGGARSELLQQHLRSAGEIAARLGPASELQRGLGALAQANESLIAAALGGSRPGGALAFESAALELHAALRHALERLGLAAEPAPDQARLRQATRSLMESVGPQRAAGNSQRFGPERALREVERALPGALSGVAGAIVQDLPRLRKATRPPEPAADGWLGRKIGDYVVTRVLGEGGMGRCLLVKRRLEQRQKEAREWVLKVPLQGIDLFRDEAKAMMSLASLNHPGIVRFLSFVDHRGKAPFLVMELVPGITLEERLSRGSLPQAQGLRIGLELASALAAAHGNGIGHFDVKPGNVLLRRDTQSPVLVDWGLAGGGMAGTPGYMSPERFKEPVSAARSPDGTPLGAPSDVFALGCVLAEMLCGAAIFMPPVTPDDDEELAAFLGQLRGDLATAIPAEAILTTSAVRERRLESALRRLPTEIGVLIRHAVSTDAKRRPSATELEGRLRSLVRSG